MEKRSQFEKEREALLSEISVVSGQCFLLEYRGIWANKELGARAFVDEPAEPVAGKCHFRWPGV